MAEYIDIFIDGNGDFDIVDDKGDNVTFRDRHFIYGSNVGFRTDRIRIQRDAIERL